MKKIKLFFGLTILCSLYLVACNKSSTTETILQEVIKPVFVESKYVRDQDYGRTFKMMSVDSNGMTIGVLKDIYTDEELIQVFDKVSADVELLNDINDISGEVLNLYILEETINGGTYLSGNKIFTTIKDFENNTYLIGLSQWGLGLEGQWKNIGIQGILSEKNIDSSELENYYTNCEDMNILGLLETRFLEEYNTDQELEVAIDTSVALTSFIISEYGYSELKTGVSASVIQEWLNSIGVNREYNNEYIEVLSKVKFEKTENFDIKAITEDVTYYITYMKEDLARAHDIEKVIYRDIIWRRTLIDLIKNKAPQYYSKYYELTKFNIIFGSERVNSYALVNEEGLSKVTLSKVNSHAHEDVHIILGHSGDNHWCHEGLAEYLSYVATPSEISYTNDLLLPFYSDLSSKSEVEELELDQLYYDKYVSDELRDKELDVRLLMDAVSYINLFVQSDYGS